MHALPFAGYVIEGKPLYSDGLSLCIINTICKNGKYSKGKGEDDEFIFISVKFEGAL